MKFFALTGPLLSESAFKIDGLLGVPILSRAIVGSLSGNWMFCLKDFKPILFFFELTDPPKSIRDI